MCLCGSVTALRLRNACLCWQSSLRQTFALLFPHGDSHPCMWVQEVIVSFTVTISYHLDLSFK